MLFRVHPEVTGFNSHALTRYRKPWQMIERVYLAMIEEQHWIEAAVADDLKSVPRNDRGAACSQTLNTGSLGR